MNRKQPRGRGASHNPGNRYHRQQTEPFDDGWDRGPATKLLTRVDNDHSRKAISYNQSPDIPFDRSVNPYRGCEHGCVYCYARPTHAWLDLSPGLDFESRLFARPDLPDLLRNELAAPSYRPAPLAVGAITDAYQPIERERQITRRVIGILNQTRHPTLIITKSSLVERDLDLLSELAADGLVEVAVSLTTLHAPLARSLEPRAAAPHRRLRTIETLSAAGIPVRAMLAPLIPVLNEAEIEDLLQAAYDVGARSASYALLRLPLEVAPLFRDWLQHHHPDAASRVMGHVQDIRNGRDNDSRFGHRFSGNGHYADLIAQRFSLKTRRLGLSQPPPLNSHFFRAPARGDTPQLNLF